jgi:hypothetical protein
MCRVFRAGYALDDEELAKIIQASAQEYELSSECSWCRSTLFRWGAANVSGWPSTSDAPSLGKYSGELMEHSVEEIVCLPLLSSVFFLPPESFIVDY